MSAGPNEAILGKIRALLNLNESNGASEHEALNAFEAAVRLMEENDITLEDIEDIRESGPCEKDMIEEIEEQIIRTIGGDAWIQVIATNLSKFFGTRAYIKRRWTGGDKADRFILFIGRKNDVEAVRLCFNWLVERGKYLGSLKAREMYPGVLWRQNEFKVSFYWGFKDAICIRIAKMLRERSEDRSSIVVYKDEAIQDYLKTQEYNINDAKDSKDPELDPLAYNAGLREGAAVPLEEMKSVV